LVGQAGYEINLILAVKSVTRWARQAIAPVMPIGKTTGRRAIGDKKTPPGMGGVLIQVRYFSFYSMILDTTMIARPGIIIR